MISLFRGGARLLAIACNCLAADQERETLQERDPSSTKIRRDSSSTKIPLLSSVALSHSSILEETLAMREKLQERNAALKCAQLQALKANEARALFRRVMSGEMKEPVAAVSKVFSTLQLENLNPEQLAMARGGLVLSSLLQDMADVSTTEESKLEVSFRPFALRPVLVEAVALSKLLCCCRGIGFECAMKGISWRRCCP